MKKFALATLPAPSPTPKQTQAEATMAIFARMLAEREQLRVQTRERMLTALSPAHRSSVATFIGELAIARDPDPAVTARQIDAVLSPSERESILRIDEADVAGSAELTRRLHVQLEDRMTLEQRTAPDRQPAQGRATLDASGASNMRSPLARGSPIVQRSPPQQAGSVLFRALDPLTYVVPVHAKGNGPMQSGTVPRPH